MPFARREKHPNRDEWRIVVDDDDGSPEVFRRDAIRSRSRSKFDDLNRCAQKLKGRPNLAEQETQIEYKGVKVTIPPCVIPVEYWLSPAMLKRIAQNDTTAISAVKSRARVLQRRFRTFEKEQD